MENVNFREINQCKRDVEEYGAMIRTTFRPKDNLFKTEAPRVLSQFISYAMNYIQSIGTSIPEEELEFINKKHCRYYMGNRFGFI